MNEIAKGASVAIGTLKPAYRPVEPVSLHFQSAMLINIEANGVVSYMNNNYVTGAGSIIWARGIYMIA